jgi:hypothetical protein
MDHQGNGYRYVKDGFVYFGYCPEYMTKDLNMIDYNIDISKNSNDKNDLANV